MGYERRNDCVQWWMENLYLLVLVVFIADFVLYTTMIEITWPKHFYQDLRAILFVTVLLKTAADKSYTKKELIIIGFCGIAFLIAFNRGSYVIFQNLFLLIAGAKGVSAKKIVQAHLIVVVVVMIVAMAGALTGRVENLIYYQAGRRRRVSMGIVYPTDFAAHVFFCTVSYVYLRREQITELELVGLIVMDGVLYWLTDARLNVICIFVTVAIVFIHKVCYRRAEKKGKTYRMNSIWSMLLALTPVLCAMFMIVASTLYSMNRKIMILLNRLLNNRLVLGHKAIDLYGFSLWGKYIEAQGYGGTIEKPEHYFVLDSSYVHMVMYYGVVLLAVVLLIWLCITFQARKSQDWMLLWCVALVMVQCMIEPHMLEIAYNPFLWLLLANTSDRSSWDLWGGIGRLKDKVYEKNC